MMWHTDLSHKNLYVKLWSAIQCHVPCLFILYYCFIKLELATPTRAWPKCASEKAFTWFWFSCDSVDFLWWSQMKNCDLISVRFGSAWSLSTLSAVCAYFVLLENVSCYFEIFMTLINNCSINFTVLVPAYLTWVSFELDYLYGGWNTTTSGLLLFYFVMTAVYACCVEKSCASKSY